MDAQLTTLPIGTAWQRTIRDKRATEALDADLFGSWWTSIDTSIERAIVRPCSYSTARRIIHDYEWLGCMPAVVWFTFGIYWENVCAGVVCYGPEYSENLGIQSRTRGRKCADWSRYGFEGKMILLSRGACVHWAHPHAASKLIRRSMDLLPPRYEVITATVDFAAGEIGTIYQACGFHYVGSMREHNANVKSRHMDRDAWLINGKLVGTRSIRALCGSVRADVITSRWPGALKVPQHSKHRYFAFRGSRRAKAHHLRAIESMIRPYPKRSVAGGTV